MKKFSKEEKLNFIIALIFIAIGASLRLVTHAPNFTPIATIALFGGVYFSRRVAIILPVLAMIFSDLFIGFYDPRLMIAVYGSFILCVGIGFWLKRNKKWYTIAGGAIASSVSFFIITNFVVWAFSSWYPKSFFGIIQCYTMALPFLRNTLAGDVFYAAVFFGAYELARALVRNKVGVKKTAGA